jgi:hypothetical protein
MVLSYMQSSQPINIVACIFHTGLDSFTGEEVYVAKHLRDRKLEPALLESTKRRPR